MKASPIQIFRSGRHTDSGGRTIDFSSDDVRRIAEAYDPALHEAAVVIGHPRTDAPAYGWIKSLSYADGALEATPHQLAPEFVEWVRAGRVKKVSASFYPPDSSRDFAPDSYYLRHVGFLGAQPPAIKGLRPVDLNDSADCVEVEFDLDSGLAADFGEADGGLVRDLFRRLREWLIGSAGQEVADQVVPNWVVDGVDVERPDPGAPKPASYSDPFERPKGDAMSQQNDQEMAAKIARLEAREQALLTREAQFAEVERNARQAGREAAIEKLVEAGKVLPADKAGFMLLFEELDGAALDFAEGRKPACDWLLGYLGRQPNQVDYAERSRPERGAATIADSGNLPRGAVMSPERVELHQRALAYAEQNKTDYITAALAVERQH